MTFLSALPAVVAAWIVLHWITREKLSTSFLLLGGVVTGAGIGLMHYAGMMAMQMAAELRFDPVDFAISIGAAIVLATLALWVRQGLMQQTKVKSVYANVIAAVVMGGAIATMHYMGMRAARFLGEPQTLLPMPASDWFYLTMLITLGVVCVLGLVSSGVLYTRLRRSMDALRVHEEELQTIIQNSTEAILTMGHDGVLNSVNHTFEVLFGYTFSEISGEHVSAFLPQSANLLGQHQKQITTELVGRRKDGHGFPVRLVLNRFDSEVLPFYVGFLVDLSDVKKLQDKLLHDAHHDFLTGLGNRRYFEDQLKLELDRSMRSGTPVSLIMLDIDFFKKVNDTYGHQVGDVVLSTLASEIRKSARSGDVVSRYGGEEFVVLLPGADSLRASEVADRLRKRVEQLRVMAGNQIIRFTISLGVACSCERVFVEAEELIKQADQAMYLAKHSGRNTVQIFVGTDGVGI